MSIPKTRAVNLRVEKYDVYIGRSSRLGNRYVIDRDGDRKEVISLYGVDFHRRLVEEPGFREYVESLKGKTLGCFCKPLPCHGDVIVEYLEGL